MKQESQEYAVKSVEIETKEVNRVIEIVRTAEFGQAVDILSKADKIVTSGSGGTGVAAKKFAHSLSCIERNGVFLSPAEGMHGGMGVVQEGDAMVVVSKGGKTAELLPLIDVCKKKGAKLIGVTQNPDSPLAKQADVFLKMDVHHESDRYDIMATSSVIALVALFDALQVAIMEETDYKLEQFALIHPGGAVGQKLNA